MNAITNEPGFYSTENEIYYISQRRLVYLVSSPDMYLPGHWDYVANLPSNATAFDEVLNADVIENLSGEISGIEKHEEELE